MEPCPCGNPSFDECCKPHLAGTTFPKTAEALMRSRYSAYVKGEIEYLGQTLHPNERFGFDRKAAKDWAESSEWLGLEIKKARGSEGDQQGVVEFIARFRQDGVEHAHHEISQFKKLNGRWFFVNGHVIPASPAAGGKVFQNDPCPCGSGKKYKRCCGQKSKAA
ncbi:MAG: YchJ family protein [Bdellovibrionota bacterium]